MTKRKIYHCFDDEANCGDKSSNCEDDISSNDSNSLSDFIIDDLPKKKIHLEKEIFDSGSDTEESEKVVSVFKKKVVGPKEQKIKTKLLKIKYQNQIQIFLVNFILKN